MEVKLTGCRLNAPIERIRSGPVVVSMLCTFEVEHPAEEGGSPYKLNYEVVGIASTKDDDEKSVRDARQRAIADAKAQLPSLGLSLNGSGTPAPVKAALQGLAATVAAPNVQAKLDEGKADKAKQLQGPANENTQNQILEQCEAMGIEPILVMGQDGGEPWTMAEAIALKAEFDKIMRRFTAGDDLQKTFKRS